MRREGLGNITLGRAPLWPISLRNNRWWKAALRRVGLRNSSPDRAARREVTLGCNGTRLRIPLGWHPWKDRSLGNRARWISWHHPRLLL